jgi:sec-independent protein translocase protein TatA
MKLLLFSFGGPEVIVIAFVIILLFGARKIPGLMKGLGQGIREFKSASKDVKKQIDEAGEDEKEEQKSSSEVS